jgi:hypothetical protein
MPAEKRLSSHDPDVLVTPLPVTFMMGEVRDAPPKVISDL